MLDLFYNFIYDVFGYKLFVFISKEKVCRFRFNIFINIFMEFLKILCKGDGYID